MTRFNQERLLNKCKINSCKEIATHTHPHNIYNILNVRFITVNKLVWSTARSSFIPRALKNERMTLGKKKDVIPDNPK